MLKRLSTLLPLLLAAIAGGCLAQAPTEMPDTLTAGIDSVVTTVTTVRTVYYNPVKTVRTFRTNSEETTGTAISPRDTVYIGRVDTVYVDRPADGNRRLPDAPGAEHHYLRNANGKIILASVDDELLERKVLVGTDTVPFILPERNFGRYHRGLYNFMFIPKGQWMFALTASYGEFNTADLEMLSVLKDFSFKGKMYSLQPSVSYFFRHNQSIGLRFKFNNARADLGGLSMDFDDDLNFSISDVSYYSHTYTSSIFYRNYVGLGSEKRFGIFNEVDLSFGSGKSVFSRLYNSEPKETSTYTTKFGLNFSPGFTMFLMDNVCFNVSIGVFGLHVTHDRQVTDGVDEGSRTSSGANFRLNLFNINFGIGVSI
ncbi:MAG: hypothetical protein K2K55_09765 [Duncaniella sp.]|nr:hypothetical protein [Duncaniella sp.]